ncbi:hypothetical protein NQ314_014566 [Rhamnusium bicolor]|uniref:Uncharacterized protein n=1 Tax=Rhamnusium bicolor TaxID=1586634 RepID=A0AAV8X2I1_9CUCU|nr:hypothetical protein NQ314_014566 [Rhamnusium bicolor]
MSTEKLLINDRQKVRDAFGKSEKDVLADIEIVRNWLKNQPHLPEITSMILVVLFLSLPGDILIESFLITNKFSIERTKQKLDMYYTIRSFIPEMYENKNPSLPHMQETFNIVYNFPLPKLTKDLYRVIVLKTFGEPEAFDVDNFLAHQMNIAEIRLQEDVALGDVYLIDYENLKMGHVVKTTPMHMRRAATVLEVSFAPAVKQL